MVQWDACLSSKELALPLVLEERTCPESRAAFGPVWSEGPIPGDAPAQEWWELRFQPEEFSDPGHEGPVHSARETEAGPPAVAVRCQGRQWL